MTPFTRAPGVGALNTTHGNDPGQYPYLCFLAEVRCRGFSQRAERVACQRCAASWRRREGVEGCRERTSGVIHWDALSGH